MTALLSTQEPKTFSSPKVELGYTVFLEGVSENVRTVIFSLHQSEFVQRLSALEENNPWHDHENVLNHVEAVFANIQMLLQFSFVKSDALKEQYHRYFSQKVDEGGSLSRKDCLLLAAACHDIGKGVVRPLDDTVAPGKTFLFTKEDGMTSGKGHEHASAVLVPMLLRDSGFTETEILWIQDIVELHDSYSKDYFDQNLRGYKDGDEMEDIRKIQEFRPGKSLELLLHISADEYGADVTKNKTAYYLHLIATHDLTA